MSARLSGKAEMPKPRQQTKEEPRAEESEAPKAAKAPKPVEVKEITTQEQFNEACMEATCMLLFVPDIRDSTKTQREAMLATMKAVERRAAPDAVVVMLPPPATCRIHPITYLRAVLDAATCPVYYYHCPPVTGVQFHAGEFARLLEHPRLAGIKNSAGDIGVRKELLKLKRDFDFRLFEGHEWGIDEALIAGCDGALCGLAALAGRPMMEIVRAVERGDFRAAREAQFKMLDIYHGIYGVDTATVQNAHKYALYRLGVFATPRCRIVSDDSLSDARKAEIDATLERFRSDLA